MCLPRFPKPWVRLAIARRACFARRPRPLDIFGLVCGRGPTGRSWGASRAALAALFFRGRRGLMPGAIGDLTRSASGYPRHPGSYKIRSGARGMGPELPAGG